ncbi:unnamed protein product, partial [Heterotrigona itama]
DKRGAAPTTKRAARWEKFPVFAEIRFSYVKAFRIFAKMHTGQLDFLKIHLPKEKWITYEQDIEYRYLDPFIEEITAERMEIYKFGCTNYSDIDWPYFEIK